MIINYLNRYAIQNLFIMKNSKIYSNSIVLLYKYFNNLEVMRNSNETKTIGGGGCGCGGGGGH